MEVHVIEDHKIDAEQLDAAVIGFAR